MSGSQTLCSCGQEALYAGMSRQAPDRYLVAMKCPCGRHFGLNVDSKRAHAIRAAAPEVTPLTPPVVPHENAKRRRPTIFADLDGMVADLLSRLLAYWNKEHKKRIKPADVEAWRDLPLDKYLVRDRVFHDLAPIAGFAEVLPRIMEAGDVFVASSPSRNPDSASDKIRWVTERFPAIHRRNIILVSAKHHLRGDIWLEDYGKNIRAIRGTNPDAFIGAIAYPYNEREKDILDARVGGPGNTIEAWETLALSVEEFARNGKGSKR